MYGYDIVSDIGHDIDHDPGEGREQRPTGSQRRYP